MCDLKQRVISSRSSGSSRLGRNKKRKIAPQALEGIIYSLRNIFQFYRIKAVKLFLKIGKCAHLYALLKELRLLTIRVLSITDVKRVPHNGMRGRNCVEFSLLSFLRFSNLNVRQFILDEPGLKIYPSILNFSFLNSFMVYCVHLYIDCIYLR